MGATVQVAKIEPHEPAFMSATEQRFKLLLAHSCLI